VSDEKLAELRTLAEAATPGPWRWTGRTDGAVELATVDRGRQYVLATQRPQPCAVYADGAMYEVDPEHTCGACAAEMRKTLDPWIDADPCEHPENLHTLWVQDDGCIRPINEFAVREVPHRSDVDRVDHPDAAYLAAVDPTTVLALLDRIAELEADLDRIIEGEP
jgi:hypothetical protein